MNRLLVFLNKYKIIICVNFLLVILAFLLVPFSKFNGGPIIYGFFAIILFVSLTCLLDDEKLVQFILSILLVYSFILEVLLHYLGFKINIEFRLLYLIPLFGLFFRKIRQRDSILFIFVCLFLIFNFLIMHLYDSTNLLFYMKSLSSFMTFIISIYLFKNYKYQEFDGFILIIYLLCGLMTIAQTILGFNNDQRNGLFGVFGMGSYSILLLYFPVKFFCEWYAKNGNLKRFILSFIFSMVLFFCTENKAYLFLLIIALLVITIFSLRLNVKHMIMLMLGIVAVPLTILLITFFYPKFSNLLDFNNLTEYLFGNNNWGIYQYGRWESFDIVYNDLSDAEIIFGRGFGTTNYLDRIFYDEMGVEWYQPYLIRIYTKNHGFDLLGLSTIVFDTGLIGLIIFILFILFLLYLSLKFLRSNDNFVNGGLIFSFILVLIFGTFYGNIFSSFKTLFFVGMFLGISLNNNHYVGDYYNIYSFSKI